MARSVRILLAVTALAWSACSAKNDSIGAPGGNGDCPSGFECDGDPSSGDGSPGDGDGNGDGDGDGGTGNGDGDGDGDGDGQTGLDDAGMPPPSVEGECKPENIVPEGCMPAMNSEASACDGLDNDCDGRVDEGCVCVPGTVQRCFGGPPGRRRVGGCDDGTQVCEGTEFGAWGDCTGGQLPTDEVCDSLDNDCNGCIDEIEDCQPALACPAPGDPRIPDGVPFSTYPLRGGDFVMNTADVASWKWTVEGTPCDTMFLAIPGSTATAENGQLSFTLTGANTQNAGLKFTLSGDYKVTMTATLADGSVVECSWIVHVRAPGVRVELCWDTTGPTANDLPVDVDLHLGKHGSTRTWFDANDCDYSTCKEFSFSPPMWGYASSTSLCPNGAATCKNPRLDIDNIDNTLTYEPENINVDRPNNGDKFRVMVHYFNPYDGELVGPETHPLVNVYCGGELRGTFGAGDDRISGFDTGGGRSAGDMWRVVDITSDVDASGVTTNCNLAPLSNNGVPNITTGNTTF